VKASDHALEARALSIGYPGRVVGAGISLQLSIGELLCLLGPNGSGKSTLFRTLLGLLPALAGEVRLQGQPAESWSRTAYARFIGYVPQAHVGMFPFTVEEVVLMGRSARIGRFAMPSAQDRQIALECLASLGIQHLQSRVYTEISGGERQLALIARALAQQPTLLVMDEPTASLDFGNQVRVLEHIQRLRAHGMGILLCTHQPEHALQVADRIALLKDGNIRYSGPAAQVATVERLAWLYDLDEGVVRASLSGFIGCPRNVCQ
jgi:iron complex transport system ATP-binding protein